MDVQDLEMTDASQTAEKRLPFVLEKVAELTGHTERAWHVAWNPSPSHPLLASCSSDKTVRLYAYTGTPSSDLPPTFTFATSIPTGHTRTVRAIAWSPSGTSLATASFDSTIGVWERAHGEEDEDEGQESGAAGAGEWECVSTLEGHENECKSVAYSAEGNLLATSGRDKSVWIWEVQPDAEFECITVQMEHSQDVKCVAWHPTEEILASGSYDDTINIYADDPADDWYPLTSLKGHTSTVWCLSFSPCGTYLASGSDDRTIRIWMRAIDRSAGVVVGVGGKERWEPVGLIPNAGERTVYSISWGAGKGGLGWLACTGGDGWIRVWEITHPDLTKPTIATPIAAIPSAHGDADVNVIAWCPRKGFEDVLATAGDDGVASVWKVVPVESSTTSMSL
ncbi:hypothetical protein BOTBODRAFT_36386 [Botryobasidium botryosum FD-172 SS1]|uniref:Probable cytosolic iron-sulfur protein assembly protein 1 n=1 Tax=Botryobasidium botryosum (strain FD-172 SS1) TaxID=930990 RepID=A0A067M6E9_BOTB1|nr:hypothetical protein BOTBODRAFT_36386 [Botryobasidium botryosum FD-172 SS1]